MWIKIHEIFEMRVLIRQLSNTCKKLECEVTSNTFIAYTIFVLNEHCNYITEMTSIWKFN